MSRLLPRRFSPPFPAFYTTRKISAELFALHEKKEAIMAQFLKDPTNEALKLLACTSVNEYLALKEEERKLKEKAEKDFKDCKNL